MKTTRDPPIPLTAMSPLFPVGGRAEKRLLPNATEGIRRDADVLQRLNRRRAANWPVNRSTLRWTSYSATESRSLAPRFATAIQIWGLPLDSAAGFL